MVAALRIETQRMSERMSEPFAELLDALDADTHAFDLFAVLRRIDALHSSNPPIGRALRPRNEPIRLGQKPSSSFAASALADLERDRNGQPAKLNILGFGLFGPNGPMPLVMTEYVRERAELHGDKALVAFFDLFHHRLIALFYRAWAEAQPTNSLDRPEADNFSRFVTSLLGLHGGATSAGADSVPEHAMLFHAGHLSRQVRNPEGLSRILSSYFQVDARIQEYVPHWLRIPQEQQTRLGSLSGSQLGVDAVAGARVFDRQHHFSIALGPLAYQQYSGLLPGRTGYQQLAEWVRNYVGLELGWQVTLVLKASEVPACRLGGSQQLGWSSWLGSSGDQDRSDLTLHPAA